MAGPGPGEEEMAVFNMTDEGESCIQVQAGKPFAVRFYARPATGYNWEFAVDPDPALLEFVAEKVEESKDGLVGGLESFVWTFRVLAAGETEISMKYVRPWEKGVEPLKRYVFKVKIMP